MADTETDAHVEVREKEGRTLGGFRVRTLGGTCTGGNSELVCEDRVGSGTQDRKRQAGVGNGLVVRAT